MAAMHGLTEQEALLRRKHGEGNDVRLATGRSYAEIARANVFNLFNLVLITIGGLLIALGRVSDALISIGPLFVANAGIRTAQEILAKRKLDRIAIANRPNGGGHSRRAREIDRSGGDGQGRSHPGAHGRSDHG